MKCALEHLHRPGVPCAVCGYGPHPAARKHRKESVNEFFGSDRPSPKYCWAVVVPAMHSERWVSVAWFATRQRAVRYAQDRYERFSIARLYPL
jgi:hypothetical protein